MGTTTVKNLNEACTQMYSIITSGRGININLLIKTLLFLGKSTFITDLNSHFIIICLIYLEISRFSVCPSLRSGISLLPPVPAKMPTPESHS